NEEYAIAMKKKQALDNLFKTGKISEATRDSFENDINAVLMEIEKQQKDLSVKMQGKMQELESQIKTLETLLANYEIQHAIGEIDEESYQREIALLSTGLETAKRELTAIKEAINQLCSPVAATVTEPSPTETIVTTQNTPVEDKVEASAEAEIIAAPIPEETVVTTEQAIPEQQPEIVSEEVVPVEIVQTAESASQPVVETPAPIENQPIITEATLQQTEPIPEAAEETPEVTEVVSQDLEKPVEIPVEPEITEEAVAVTEDSLDVTEHPQDVAEEVLQVIESSPEIVEEIVDKAHPQKAPEEAHQEVTVEGTSDQEQDIEEMVATADTEGNTETEEA
ncbi:MAG: CdvA-like protein, partial [Candidatus Bathyarchaeales archaeon]